MKWLFGRGWLDARTVFATRCLLAVAIVASLMSLVIMVRMSLIDPGPQGKHEAFFTFLPQFVRFAVAHVLIPLIFALYPRRITNIVFWASAIYLIWPWYEIALNPGHAMDPGVRDWFGLHGIVIFVLVFYTAICAEPDQKRRHDA